jgi:hypothetical protein
LTSPQAALKEKLIERTYSQFPALSMPPFRALIADQLLSAFHLTLPIQVLQQAQKFVSAAFHLRTLKAYTSHFAQELQNLQLKEPGNHSILMSYDFHLDTTGQLKLIEVNTNASFLAIGDLMYQANGIPQPIPDFNMEEIRSNIENEMKLNGFQAKSGMPVAIIDENPEEQKLFAEFLIFAEHFKSWGWNTQVCDYRNLPRNFDFIYNRTTDFLLSDPSSASLRELYNSRKSTLSPHPVEYIYLASKSRFLDWQKPGFLESMGLPAEEIIDLLHALPKNLILNATNATEIWQQRKTLFFKPFQSYGAKQTYRGSGITKKTFEEISSQGFLAQEYVAPSEIERETPTGPQKFKYDLRFYAYQDRIQSVIARIYQGQLTNLRTPLGGFACVKFN